MTRYVVLGLVSAAGIAIAVAWGARALLVFAFFAAIAAGLSYAAGVGGNWLEGVSRRRFDDDRPRS